MATTEAKVKYGLSGVRVALRTEADGKISYSTPEVVPGAVNLTLTEEQAEALFYADNKVYFRSSKTNRITGDLEMADFTKSFMEKYLNYMKSATGSLLKTDASSDTQFALLFQIETDQKARKFCLYNTTASEGDAEDSTTEDTIEPATSTISITCAGETVGDKVVFKEVCYPDDTNYDTFFTTVSVPAFAATAA